MKEWTCPGLKNVIAYTKSEARSLFKRQLRELESMTFKQQLIRRLPAHTPVKEVQT